MQYMNTKRKIISLMYVSKLDDKYVNRTYFTNSDKAEIIYEFLHEAKQHELHDMLCSLNKDDILHIMTFLYDFNDINALVAQTTLINKIYDYILEMIEEIINNHFSKFCDDNEHLILDNIERANDMNAVFEIIK